MIEEQALAIGQAPHILTHYRTLIWPIVQPYEVAWVIDKVQRAPRTHITRAYTCKSFEGRGGGHIQPRPRPRPIAGKRQDHLTEKPFEFAYDHGYQLVPGGVADLIGEVIETHPAGGHTLFIGVVTFAEQAASAGAQAP